jgi:membrane DNA delivery protein
MDKAGEALIAIVTAAFTVAIVAVLVSQRANTSGVLTGFGQALSGIINAAVSPLGGGSGG